MKVLLFARDPGGANAVVPLAPILAERGHEVFLYGKDAALKQYLVYGQGVWTWRRQRRRCRSILMPDSSSDWRPIS